MREETLWQTVTVLLMLAWVVFALAFFARKRPPQSKEKKRVSTSFGAIALQGVGFALTWSLRRTPFTPIFPARMWLQVVLAIAVVALAGFALWMVNAAVRTLGKQWALAARVVEGHNLITAGPYRLVRHPIYSGMFMMLVATGLVVGRWEGLLPGMTIFLAGTLWRVRIEEKLLIETFGSAYEEYKRKVPAFIPWKLSTR
ncbi:MAG TPA: isoprenylcysteine carboxylmethyltransferase family protein [Candidatus Krumholzibacteria bacterium]|nr:isoprenylcysteine carboxylmethyltransferase family protein [Candidatus Krumholzibacteria bacterium]